MSAPGSHSTSGILREAAPRRRSVRKIFIGTVTAVVTLAVVLVVAAAGFGYWLIQKSFPQVEGTLKLRGLDSVVTVTRDARGIPTITAENNTDLMFAQGYVHAQDRFWEMDVRRHITAGRLSEMFGPDQVATDKLLRTMGWRRVAQQEVEQLSAEAKSFYQAYADGVNAYLASHKGAALSLEYAVLGLQTKGYEPQAWEPADSVAWFKAMAWDLKTNLDDEVERAKLAGSLGVQQLEELYPGYRFGQHPTIVQSSGTTEAAGSAQQAQPTLSADAAARVSEVVRAAGGGAHEGVGSNSWVVSGQLTASGKPLLANDPHLGAAMPSTWTQVHLRCKQMTASCDFDVAGFSFSGLPGVVIGHNQQVAWGFTNLTTDVSDLFVERLSADGRQVLKDGQLLDVSVMQDTIRVAGGESVPLTIRSTSHGPIVSDVSESFGATAQAVGEAPADPRAPQVAVSLGWTALTPGRTAEAIFILNRAANFDDLRRAAAEFDVPAQNLVYADVDGNIGYQAPGRLPIRGESDGWLPTPGWDSKYDWKGFIPFDELPSVYNPEEGFIVTANNAIVDQSYPYFLSRDWDYGFRAQAIVQRLRDAAAQGKITAQVMRDIQMDNQAPFATTLQQLYAQADVKEQLAGSAGQAVELLAGWDGRNEADSAAAAFGNVLFKNLCVELFRNGQVQAPLSNQSRLATVLQWLADTPQASWWRNDQQGVLVRAATAAVAELESRQGADQGKWNWGELHALTLTNQTLGTSGIAVVERLFNRGPFPVSGGSSIVNATGWDMESDSYATETVPSFRTVMDTSNWDASTWVHLTGQSGHAFNEHYYDQTEAWVTNDQYQWVFSETLTTRDTKTTLTLEPKAA